jgi:hypothetical protein
MLDLQLQEFFSKLICEEQKKHFVDVAKRKGAKLIRIIVMSFPI